MLNTGIVCVLCVPEQSPVRIYSHYVFEYSLASFRSIECLYPSPVGVAKRFPPTGKKSSSISVYSAKRNDESRSRFPFLYCSHGALSNEEYVYEKKWKRINQNRRKIVAITHYYTLDASRCEIDVHASDA